MKKWNELKVACYGKKRGTMNPMENIDFSSGVIKDIVGGEKLSYDEYLEIMKVSAKECRHYFEMCYYECALTFKGQIEKKNGKNVCFKRIFVEGMYRDGECFDGKEDHVWMPLEGFEKYAIGDSVSFFAEVYRYLKTSNGKKIDYGLRNPKDIKKIDEYQLPSDDDLLMEIINSITCENCYLNEKCDKLFCLRNGKEIISLKKEMFKLFKS